MLWYNKKNGGKKDISKERKRRGGGRQREINGSSFSVLPLETSNLTVFKEDITSGSCAICLGTPLRDGLEL